MPTHRRVVLAARPSGVPTESDFRLEESPVPDPADGEFLIESVYLSVDPYMRGRMRDVASYAAPLQLGEVMTGGGVGRVAASRNPRYAVGDWVEGMTGWQTHLVTRGAGFRKIDPTLAPPSTALGVLGMPGLTAYFGLLEVGAARAGDTVVVSGAAGAVGSAVGQIAKIAGCRVVGIAGSDDKVAWLTGDLGFDAAFNYKTESDYRARIRDLCPSGVDVYFDNVGGPISDAVMPSLAQGARVAVCGQISQYNNEQAEQGPRQWFHLIVKRARVEGFLVFDFANRYDEGRERLTGWVRAGRIQYREHFEDGIERMPAAFIGMLGGANTGKMLVRVRPE
ncbi:MAG: NADP-dependent oxidoreductase [Bryobacteraceae bacterium]